SRKIGNLRSVFGRRRSRTSGSMVLWHTQGIRIAKRKEWLQVLLDVVPGAYAVECVEHAQRIILPVGRLGHWQIVDAANLVQIDESVRRLDDGERRLDIEGW